MSMTGSSCPVMTNGRIFCGSSFLMMSHGCLILSDDDPLVDLAFCWWTMGGSSILIIIHGWLFLFGGSSSLMVIHLWLLIFNGDQLMALSFRCWSVCGFSLLMMINVKPFLYDTDTWVAISFRKWSMGGSSFPIT